MKKKEQSSHHDISVNGHYVSEISSRHATHRIYHYQVTVGQSTNTASRNYEGELHIREAIPSPLVTDEVVPDGHNKGIEHPQETDTGEEMPGDDTGTPHHPDVPVLAKNVPVTEDNEDTIPTDVTVARTPSLSPAIDKPAKHYRTQTKLIKPIYARCIKSAEHFLHTLSGYATGLLMLRNKITVPVIKLPPQRKIFSNKPRHITGLATLAIALVIGAATVMYLRLRPQTHPPLDSQAAKAEQPVPQAESAYKAVIEKTGDGVVITLQGPDHEEVLTRLPPGYSPVLEGNKVVHIVTPGNTLWFIAKRYVKNPYRYPELARLNKIPNPDLIYPGDKVIIQFLRKP